MSALSVVGPRDPPATRGRLASWGRDLIDLLLPGRCLGCGTGLPFDRSRDLICPGCSSRLRPPPWPRCPRCHYPRGTGRPTAAECLECQPWPGVLAAARSTVVLAAARSTVVLEPPADALVHAFKYQGWRELAPVLAGTMASLPLPPAAAAPLVVVPVPTTRKRRRSRGYDQALLLAEAYAARRRLPLLEALQREGDRATQVSLHPDERRANVRGAFAPTASGTCLGGAHVLLVDDVLTTGATAGEAARMLERAGARGVSLVTFARALPSHRRQGVP